MAEAQSIVKDDRGGTVVPEETTRLKTLGPCEKCGGRWWRGPTPENIFTPHPTEISNWVSTPNGKYFAECRNCGRTVRL